jgi:hypothetical protein
MKSPRVVGVMALQAFLPTDLFIQSFSACEATHSASYWQRLLLPAVPELEWFGYLYLVGASEWIVGVMSFHGLLVI